MEWKNVSASRNNYKEKELLFLGTERKCFTNLRFIKEEEHKRSFPYAEAVKRFMNSCKEAKEKIHRMYIEIGYAKAS